MSYIRHKLLFNKINNLIIIFRNVVLNFSG